MGKLRIRRGVGPVPQVSLTLAENICAPIKGITELVRLFLRTRVCNLTRCASALRREGDGLG